MAVLTNTGGPAFPVTEQNGANYGDCGMTLRDYFAAAALPAILAQVNFHDFRGLANASSLAYQVADSMLEDR